MLRFLRFLWKLFVLASAFGIGYIIGREHSFEEDEEWENEEEEKKDQPSTTASTPAPEAASGPAKSVDFQFADAKATSVAIVGDFNDWNKDKSPMKLENGTWKVALSLKPGRHEYKFVVNNTDWITDPKCPETVADKYGGRSSIVDVR